MRMLKFISFYHFWTKKQEEQTLHLKNRALVFLGFDRFLSDNKKRLLSSFFKFEVYTSSTYNFKARIRDTLKEIGKVAFSPMTYVGLELAAIFGTLISPYDGRKVYASLERFQYGGFLLAPCFQPSAKYHAFGGDINKRGAF